MNFFVVIFARVLNLMSVCVLKLLALNSYLSCSRDYFQKLEDKIASAHFDNDDDFETKAVITV